MPGIIFIAHSVDKEEGKIPQPFKGTKPKQTGGRGKPKGKPQEQRRNPPKPKRQMKLVHMIALTIIITMIIILPQVRVKAADLLMVKVVTKNLEVLHNKTEAKDLNIVNVNYRFQRGTFQQNHTQYSNKCKPYFQGNQANSYRGRGHGWGPQQFRGRGCGRANYQSSNGTYQYEYYTHDPQTEQYGPPCSLCGSFNHFPKHCYKGEHDINNIMEKMSINPHQQQQSNLYQ